MPPCRECCVPIFLYLKIRHMILSSILHKSIAGLHMILSSILHKSIAGRYRPVSYPDGPITARYRFMWNASWAVINFGGMSYVHVAVVVYWYLFVYYALQWYMYQRTVRPSSVVVHKGRVKRKSVLKHAFNAQIQIHTAHSQSLIRAFALRENIIWYLVILFADSEGPDQTAHTHRLIWAFAVHIGPKIRFCMVRPK